MSTKARRAGESYEDGDLRPPFDPTKVSSDDGSRAPAVVSSVVPRKPGGNLKSLVASINVQAAPEPAQASIEQPWPDDVGPLSLNNAKLVWLHHSKFKVWHGNPRHVLDEEDLLTLKATIEVHGQSDPVDCFEDPENPGTYLLVRGQRRWTAVRRWNLQDGLLLAAIRNEQPPLDVLYAAAIDTQDSTQPLTDLDYAISLAKVAEKQGVVALSRSLGRSRGDVSKLKQIGGLPEELLSVLMLNAKKFSRAFAYEVVLVNEHVGTFQAVDFAKEIVSKGYSVKSTITARENLMGDRTPARRSSWSTFRLSLSGRQAGSLRVRDDTGQVDLKLKGLTKEQMEVLKTAVEHVTGQGNSQG